MNFTIRCMEHWARPFVATGKACLSSVWDISCTTGEISTAPTLIFRLHLPMLPMVWGIIPISWASRWWLLIRPIAASGAAIICCCGSLPAWWCFFFWSWRWCCCATGDILRIWGKSMILYCGFRTTDACIWPISSEYARYQCAVYPNCHVRWSANLPHDSLRNCSISLNQEIISTSSAAICLEFSTVLSWRFILHLSMISTPYCVPTSSMWFLPTDAWCRNSA